jgi:cob(I)alamin adenosyltransferase
MDLRYEMRKDHLRVVATGKFEAARARIELSNIIRQSATSGITRILIDARGITNEVPISDRYDLATQLADQSQGRVRLAIVVADINLFTKTLEDTATNRGVAVKTTGSMDEAVEFLGICADRRDQAA